MYIKHFSSISSYSILRCTESIHLTFSSKCFFFTNFTPYLLHNMGLQSFGTRKLLQVLTNDASTQIPRLKAHSPAFRRIRTNYFGPSAIGTKSLYFTPGYLDSGVSGTSVYQDIVVGPFNQKPLFSLWHFIFASYTSKFPST